MLKVNSALVIMFMTLLPVMVFSQAKQESKSSSMFFLYMTAPTFAILDNDAAEREGLETSVTGIDFGFDMAMKYGLVAGGNVGLEFPGDKLEFAQSTTRGEMSSSVTIPSVSLDTGLRLRPIALGKGSSKHLLGSLLLGRSWLTNARRSIDDCKDCRKDEINLDISYYVEPEVAFVFVSDSGMLGGIGLYYQYFLDSEYTRRIGLKFLFGAK